MSDKLIIEIDGNATGLTNELKKADSRLNTFNKKIAESNRVIQGFQNKLNTSTNAITRLTASTNKLDTNIKGINRSFLSLSNSLTRINKNAATSAASIAAMGKSAGTASTQFAKLATSTQAVNNMMTSMSRRMNALNATVSSLNTALRGLTRHITTHGIAVNTAAASTRRMTGATLGLGAASNTATLGLNRMNRASVGVAEGFRRTVAQITALRTITYQGLFWFAPLIYSVVKTNAAYEKQMVLLTSVARATSQVAKEQEAVQTREWLLNKAETNPFSLDQITNSFVKMRVGGIEPMDGALQTMMDSIASFGGSNAALDRAAVAIQQMGGKGVISMEELRQQLGEHVPTAAKAMAAGIGISMGELYKTIESGTLESTDALGKMFAVLRNMHLGDAKKMMETWDGLMARLGTAWSKFVVQVTTSQGSNSFIEKLKKTIEDIINFMNTPAGVNFAISVQNAMAEVLDIFVSLIEFMYEYREIILTVAILFATYWGGRFVLGALVGVFTAMRAGMFVVKSLSVLMAALTGRTTAAAAAQVLFGTSVRRSARALGVLNAAGAISIRTLGLLALRFAGIVGAAIAAAGAIWLVVSALNAKSRAEKQAKEDRAAAEEGGMYEDKDEYAKGARKVANAKRDRDSGQVWVQNSNTNAPRAGYFRKMTKEEQRAADAKYEDARYTHNLKTSNMNQNRRGNRVNTFTQTHSKGYEAGLDSIREQRAIKMGGNLTEAEVKQNEIAFTEGRLKFSQGQLEATRSKLKNSKDKDERAALSGIVERLEGEVKTDTEGLKFLKGESVRTSKDGEGGPKKKKGAGGSKVDPAERFRNKFENEFGQSAELENEYRNTRDGTDNVFDAEAAHDAAVAISRGKSIEQLKELIVLEQSKQRELKKSIAVEKAILDIQDQTADMLSDIRLGYLALETGYESIQVAAQAFREELEREKRAELAIVEARIAANDVTQEQINQYRELKESIELAVQAKQAEAILDLARRADDASKQYRRSFQSSRINQIEDLNDERKPISEAIGIIKTSPEELDRRRLEINEQLKDSEERLRAARAKGDNEEILVQGRKIKDLETINSLMERGLPFLEKRNEEIEKEVAAREKWNGAGAPLLDWAREAAKDMDDLGASMGNLLINQFDSLIDGFINGKVAFGDFVKSMLKGLLAIIIRAMIARAILAALGYGGGNSGVSTDGGLTGGFINTGVGHTGMMVGGSAPQHRGVDASTFSFAKRYHTGGIVGLRPNEVPIIAERGEGVFTKEQMKAMGGSANASSNVQVNVINQTGTEAKVERSQPKFDGEKWVEEIILKKMSQPGPVRTMIQGGKR